MEEMNTDEIVLAKLSDVELSPEQEKLFEEWYSHPENREHFSVLMREQAAAIAAKAKSVDTGAAWGVVRPRQRLSVGKRAVRYAAAVLVPAVLAVTAYYFAARPGTDTDGHIVEPGQFKAVLTLSNGEQVPLSQSVESLAEGGVRIANAEEGLTYEAQAVADDGPVAFNTVYIPRGGFYKVELADGTAVWLNSGSSLRYPVAFGQGERTVELHGEAYFIVAADPERPFVVAADDYRVRVTGTQFNVRSYAPGATATTLVQGAVQLERDGKVSTLRPDQQGTFRDGRFVVEEVDPVRFTAWYRGEFSFSLATLEDIMGELSRWYDIEVSFSEPELRGIRFSAGFSREAELNEILEILGKTEKVNFTLKGRTLTVSRR